MIDSTPLLLLQGNPPKTKNNKDFMLFEVKIIWGRSYEMCALPLIWMDFWIFTPNVKNINIVFKLNTNIMFKFPLIWMHF